MPCRTCFVVYTKNNYATRCICNGAYQTTDTGKVAIRMGRGPLVFEIPVLPFDGTKTTFAIQECVQENFLCRELTCPAPTLDLLPVNHSLPTLFIPLMTNRNQL